MVRLSPQAHQRRVMITMTIYVVVLLWVWPLLRSAGVPWLKTVYALMPVLPILYVIWLMAHRVLAGDELEQRTHLIGLGVAAAVTSIFGIVTGFLAMADIMPADFAGAALVWIFPLMLIVHAAVRSIAARRYGGGACDEDNSLRAASFLYLTALFSAIGAYVYWHKSDTKSAVFALGMAAGMFVCATIFAVRARLRKRGMPE